MSNIINGNFVQCPDCDNYEVLCDWEVQDAYSVVCSECGSVIYLNR